MSSTSNAREWLAAYRKAHRPTLSAAQIKAISTCARQIDAGMSLAELADVLRTTSGLSPQATRPIYMIGPATADYLLSILPEAEKEAPDPSPERALPLCVICG